MPGRATLRGVMIDQPSIKDVGESEVELVLVGSDPVFALERHSMTVQVLDSC